jgi:4-hydroxybenzoate polyprenyltransferase
MFILILRVLAVSNTKSVSWKHVSIFSGLLFAIGGVELGQMALLDHWAMTQADEPSWSIQLGVLLPLAIISVCMVEAFMSPSNHWRHGLLSAAIAWLALLPGLICLSHVDSAWWAWLGVVLLSTFFGQCFAAGARFVKRLKR